MVHAVGGSPTLYWGSAIPMCKDIPGTDKCSLAAFEAALMCGDTLEEDEQTISVILHMKQATPNGYGIADHLEIGQVLVTIYGHNVPASECSPIIKKDERGFERLYYCNDRVAFENPRGYVISIESVESEFRSVRTEMEMLLPPGIEPCQKPRIEIEGGDVRVIFYKKSA